MNERDRILEDAIQAAAKAATAFGNRREAVMAWQATHALKALRHPDVTARLEFDRLAKAGA